MKAHRFIPKTGLVERIEALLDVARGKNILHIGLGGFVDDEAITNRFAATDLTVSLHGRLAQTACAATGLDVNPVMVKVMQEKVPGDYVVADITETGLADRLGRKFDAVLFPEVIEHLDCFNGALDNIRGLLVSDGVLVLTTINAYCFDHIVKMLFRYEAVHEEHTCYFSYRTLKRLLEMNGFAVDKISFYFERRSEFSSVFERIAYYMMRAIISVFPQYAEGLVVLAHPSR